MLQSVRETLVQTQYYPNLSDLEQLAKPIAAQMRELKPSLTRRFDTCTLLHVLFFYLYHRFSGLKKRFPAALRILHDKKYISKIQTFKPLFA